MLDNFLIRGLQTISPFGVTLEETSLALSADFAPATQLSPSRELPVFRLTDAGEQKLLALRADSRYAKLDRVTLLAIAAARETLRALPPLKNGIGCVSIGSSRGATTSLEQTIAIHNSEDSAVPTHTSPQTTAGNISSWVAQEYLSLLGSPSTCETVASISTSMTCSSAFQSLLVAYAFVRGGLAPTALFGGAEACLTSYTIAQLRALRIYSEHGGPWPCRPLSAEEGAGNSVALGEAGGTALLTTDDSAVAPGDMRLLGLGWAVEETPSATGITADGRAFEHSMRKAIASLPTGAAVDAVILHAPGSRKGDLAELRAVNRVFGDISLLTTKHLTGHTYGASGMVSLALAQALLEGAPWSGLPYPTPLCPALRRPPRSVAINTAGFGGNSITVIVSRAA